MSDRMRVSFELREQMYVHLRDKAEKKKMTVHSFAMQIIEGWIADSRERERIKQERESKHTFDTKDEL